MCNMYISHMCNMYAICTHSLHMKYKYEHHTCDTAVQAFTPSAWAAEAGGLTHPGLHAISSCDSQLACLLFLPPDLHGQPGARVADAVPTG